MGVPLGDDTNWPLKKPASDHDSELVVEIEEIVEIVVPEVRKELQDWMRQQTEAADRAAREAKNTVPYAETVFDELYRSKEHKICKLDSNTIQAVTIGPYHRSCKRRVKFNDRYKWEVVKYIAKQRKKFQVGTYLKEMAEKEGIARRYYKDEFPKIKSEDFQVMLLLDSAFILFVLDALGNNDLCPSDYYPTDYIALFHMVKDSIMQINVDLLTLDNQIPFFAVEQLYVISHGGATDKGDYSLQEKFRALVLSGFDDLYPKRNQDKSGDLRDLEFHHLLHLFHWSRVPEGKYGSMSELLQLKMDLVLYIPSATELQKSATTFRKKASGSFLDITFRDSLNRISGEMTVPTVHLDDYSRDLFHNLIAFEKNFIENGCCVMAYCKCMSRILQQEADVNLLRDEGIVSSTSYRDADVIKFFEDFNKQVKNESMPHDLLNLYAKVAKHHKSSIRNNYGRMKLQYFPNWWVGLSIVAGFVLFLLSLLQTIYAMSTYNKTYHTLKID